MWSLHDDEKKLKPLVFSNGKSQADVVKEVMDAIGEGYKMIFIKGVCGTGKSAIALNLARKIGRTSIVVPIKSLQEQYTQDYTDKMHVLKKGQKLKICSVVGRNNFKCRFLEGEDISDYGKEKNAKLNDIFEGVKPIVEKDDSCDNSLLPCKIELKERNLYKIKEYLKKNPSVNVSDFANIKEVTRMSVAPVCPYWCPIVSNEFEMRKYKDVNKISYDGLEGKKFTIYQRKKGCGFYDQYESYKDADVLIFNSLKYKLESLMDRKPATDLEVIDECDEFLDNFANQEQVSLGRLSYALEGLFVGSEAQELLNKLIDITNTIKLKYKNSRDEIFSLKGSPVYDLLKEVLDSSLIMEGVEDESNYVKHLYRVAEIFEDFFEDTYFEVEEKEKDLVIKLVTTNLAKRLEEMILKNKIIVMMSGTIHSENILKNIFGLEKFKIIEAEIEQQGELIKSKYGYEMDCKYTNMKAEGFRERYLNALSKCVSFAKKPAVVQVNSFGDLPSEKEKREFEIENLPARNELINEQNNDPLGKRVIDFKKGKSDVLFTTRSSRGVDFPGEVCNSIIITRFPYPNISSLFWKILKKTNPQHFMSFYMDKARRELIQKISRGLRFRGDKVQLLSPDSRVFGIEF